MSTNFVLIKAIQPIYEDETELTDMNAVNYLRTNPMGCLARFVCEKATNSHYYFGKKKLAGIAIFVHIHQYNLYKTVFGTNSTKFGFKVVSTPLNPCGIISVPGSEKFYTLEHDDGHFCYDIKAASDQYIRVYYSDFNLTGNSLKIGSLK